MRNGLNSQPVLTKSEEAEKEEIKQVLCGNGWSSDEALSKIVKTENLSLKNKLMRITAWLYRFIHNCRSQEKQKSKFLTAAEFKGAVYRKFGIRRSKATS